MNSSFAYEKDLRFTFILGGSTFNSSGANIVTVQGLRASVEIEKAGGMTMSPAKCRIWGLSADTMNALTMLSMQTLGVVRNTLQIEAIDGDTVTTVFSGQIKQAWPDFQQMPDVHLYVEAINGWFDNIASVPPTSYKGDVSVSQIMRTLAVQMDRAFEDNGVTARLSNPYLSGTTTDKVYQVAKAAGIDIYLDDFVLAITPKGQPRGGQIPLISQESGLIGFPQWDQVGVTFRTLFNQTIIWGGMVKIESAIPQASGVWTVQQVAHSLSSRFPGGPWQSTIRCTESGLVPIK